MGTPELFLIALGLSMDAFAVCVCKGLGMRRIDARTTFLLALSCGGFQGLLPVVGWLLGSQLLWLIEPVDHWIAFGLLGLIGGSMIREALTEDEQERGPTGHVAWTEIVMLGVATSIDALAVGVSFAALSVPIGLAALLIFATTFVLSVAGVFVGNFFGARFEKVAQVVGGIVLIAIGIRVLVEHLS